LLAFQQISRREMTAPIRNVRREAGKFDTMFHTPESKSRADERPAWLNRLIGQWHETDTNTGQLPGGKSPRDPAGGTRILLIPFLRSHRGKAGRSASLAFGAFAILPVAQGIPEPRVRLLNTPCNQNFAN